MLSQEAWAALRGPQGSLGLFWLIVFLEGIQLGLSADEADFSGCKAKRCRVS